MKISLIKRLDQLGEQLQIWRICLAIADSKILEARWKIKKKMEIVNEIRELLSQIRQELNIKNERNKPNAQYASNEEKKKEEISEREKIEQTSNLEICKHPDGSTPVRRADYFGPYYELRQMRRHSTITPKHGSDGH